MRVIMWLQISNSDMTNDTLEKIIHFKTIRTGNFNDSLTLADHQHILVKVIWF